MDKHTQEAMKKITRANKGVLLAMGALLVASLNATQAMQHLQEVLRREKLQEAAESNGDFEEPAEKMEEIIEDYSKEVN